MAEPLLDVAGAAAYLNVSTRTVERIVAEERLVPLWVRGQRCFTVPALFSARSAS